MNGRMNEDPEERVESPCVHGRRLGPLRPGWGRRGQEKNVPQMSAEDSL